jgi:hypothetical protein
VRVKRSLAGGLVACSLEPAQLASRWVHWRGLLRRAALAVASTERGLRLEFRDAPGVESELRELIWLERICCRFADWSLRADADRLVLEVGGRTDEGVAAVRAMFGTMAHPARVVSR